MLTEEGKAQKRSYMVSGRNDSKFVISGQRKERSKVGHIWREEGMVQSRSYIADVLFGRPLTNASANVLTVFAE